MLRLSEFFRYAVRQEGHFAEFAQEYFFVRTYLSLEQARFGERLAIRYDIDPQVLTSRVPVLTIQPLVENAVKHGIEPRSGPGWIGLRTWAEGEDLVVEVTDDGVGLQPGSGSGVGLANVRGQLAMRYGDRASFQIRGRSGEGTRAAIRIPLEEGTP